MENKKKDIIINEKENELDVAREELKDLLETCFKIKKEKEEKDEALNIAIGQTNSLEDEKRGLQVKLKSYSNAIKKLRSENEVERTLIQMTKSKNSSWLLKKRIRR